MKKSLQQFNQVITIIGVFIKEKKVIIITEPKTFLLWFI